LRSEGLPNAYGHHLKFVILVRTARNPHPQVKLKANLLAKELIELHEINGKALAQPLVQISSSAGESVTV